MAKSQARNILENGDNLCVHDSSYVYFKDISCKGRKCVGFMLRYRGSFLSIGPHRRGHFSFPLTEAKLDHISIDKRPQVLRGGAGRNSCQDSLGDSSELKSLNLSFFIWQTFTGHGCCVPSTLSVVQNPRVSQTNAHFCWLWAFPPAHFPIPVRMHRQCMAAFTANVQHEMCLHASPFHLVVHSPCLFLQMLRAEHLWVPAFSVQEHL